MWERIFNLVLKEFLQLRRDRQARFRLVIPPLIQMIIFGYAATFEVYHVSTAVLDLDHSQERVLSYPEPPFRSESQILKARQGVSHF